MFPTAAGRWQLASSAGQAASRSSLPQPGRSFQSTATQRAADACGAGCAGNGLGPGTSRCSGGDEQATRLPRIAANPQRAHHPMLLLILEAFGALLVLVLIVWWTMFSGRDKGERRKE